MDSLQEDRDERLEVAEGSGEDRDPLEDEEPLYDTVDHSENSE